jgi:hypothetical protein
MFSIEQLAACTSQPWFSTGYASLERNLLLSRLGLAREDLAASSITMMKRFSQAVIGSAPTWTNPREGEGNRQSIVARHVGVSQRAV